jgi:hypothetical protein
MKIFIIPSIAGFGQTIIVKTSRILNRKTRVKKIQELSSKSFSLSRKSQKTPTRLSRLLSSGSLKRSEVSLLFHRFPWIIRVRMHIDAALVFVCHVTKGGSSRTEIGSIMILRRRGYPNLDFSIYRLTVSPYDRRDEHGEHRIAHQTY